jgi:hypothetical protein
MWSSTLIKSTNSNHEFHAINVTGICGGPIMCETRRSIVPLRCTHNHDDANDSAEPITPTPFFRGGGRGKRKRERGGEGGAKYERPVLRERTYDEPADGFQVVSKRDKKARHVI